MSGSGRRGWYLSPGGFLLRTLQAADENNVPFLASALTFDALLAAVPFFLLLLVGLTALAQAVAGVSLGNGTTDLTQLFHRFLPPHDTTPGADPFAVIERILTRITERRGQVSLVAVPAFVWFSTRLFAGVRTALNEIFDVSVRPTPRRHPVIAYLRGKSRDAGMVLAMLLLFLGNTAVIAGLAYLESRGAAEVGPHFRFWVSWIGRLVGEALAFAFQLILFYVVYRYASVRRIPGRIALIASVFSAVFFEVAKRLYGLYLTHLAALESVSGDGQVGAVVLFVLWVYYTAIVFLVGGVVAETWELRTMQTQQRGRME